MQSVDASRTELRELNELTVGRLESRMGEVRHELRGDIAALDGRVNEFRHELKTDIAALDGRVSEFRHELKTDIAALRLETRTDTGALREEMRVGFAGLEARIDRRFGDLIKWSFLFWCGAVAAAALARG